MIIRNSKSLTAIQLTIKRSKKFIRTSKKYPSNKPYQKHKKYTKKYQKLRTYP